MIDRRQLGIGAGVLVLAALLGLGASQIPSEAGYAGVGPNFLPWLVAAALAVCGAWLAWEACTGGFRRQTGEPASGGACWTGLAWVSAGLVLNALLITRLGFVLSCALLFACAARGFRRSEGQPADAARALRDVLIGLAISAPAYWVFTKGLGLALPALTSAGWI
ncbi:MAG TPA: tripartite tricarboxylate transporter TctB family protein [Burkholderiaceae bacterium]|nr:tripartite tricarboxylate transporter TctB family protein [Burkholderiaceae bacterium]